MRFKKFLSYYRPYRGLLFADLFFAMLAAAISLTYPLVVRFVTNVVLVEYSASDATTMIVKVGVFLICLVALEYGANFFITYKGHQMGALMERDMRTDIFAHYQKLSFSFFDNHKTGQLMTRITNDLFDVTELAHHGPEDVIISVIKFVGSFTILANINLKLTLIVFAFVPVMFVFALIVKRMMNRAFRRNRERIADINAGIEDNLSGIRVVKSFTNEEREQEKFAHGNNRFLESKSNSYHVMAYFHGGLNFFIGLINAAVVVGGAYLIAGQTILLTDFITFVLYIGNFVEPVKKLINFTEQFENGITGFERFCEILSVEPDIADSKDAVELVNVRGEVEFQNVAFSYSEDTEVFHNINLKVLPGEYVALCGTSGVGKTTLCSLIPRFYEVTGGQVLFDGQDVRDLKIRSLRENIGIVQQNVYLFSGTVLENIRYGRLDANDEAVVEAAKRANAHDFIVELPNGYHTDIGQRGVKLSGGQQQRLSIARVFLKDPRVLIFDEATSALDNESEHIVQQSLEELAKERTTFVIAHRLSTIQNADSIIVLTDSGIAERGSHSELLAKNGVYAGLYGAGQRE